MKHWIRNLLCLCVGLAICFAQADLRESGPVPSMVVQSGHEQVVGLPSKPVTEALHVVAVPVLKSPVTDLTGTLDSNSLATLRQRLLALQQRKGSQVAVLMLPSTGEDSIEQFATRVFEQWHLGRKGVDDGVLVLIAKDDRRMRIEVGYGLEGAIPDVVAGRIIREEMVPAFRNGDYAGGIELTVSKLERLIDGEALPQERRGSESPNGWLLLFALAGGAVAGIVLIRHWLDVRVALKTLAAFTAVLMVASVLLSPLALLPTVPFSILLGTIIGAVAARSRRSAWKTACIVGYLLAIWAIATYFSDGRIVLFFLAFPITVAVVLALLFGLFRSGAAGPRPGSDYLDGNSSSSNDSNDSSGSSYSGDGGSSGGGGSSDSW
jgi:uncharacterized protein